VGRRSAPRRFEEFPARARRGAGSSRSRRSGPDTLKELARAFAGIDGYTHVSRFLDMHDLGDMLVQSGFADPVMDMEMLTVTYASPRRAACRAQGARRDQPERAGARAD
jgi:malonyl-CoA O-methyltransferase